MNIRTVVLATVVAAGLLATTACSVTPGSAAVVPAASAAPATITVTASASAAPASTAPSAAPGSSMSPDTSQPETSESPEPSDSSSGSRQPSTAASAVADATTTAWVDGICTGMGNVLDELVNKKPNLTDTTALGTLRQALVDYYAASSKTADDAYTASQQIEPPKVADGPTIHQAYQHFLSGLTDIFYNATMDMSGAADLASIKAINNDVDTKITALGSDNSALSAMASGPLAEIATTLPSCQKVKQLSS